MLRTAFLAVLSLAASCAMTTSVPEPIRAEMAPGGVLRAGINLGNPTVVQKDPAGGPLRGVGPELARELAKRLGARLEFVTYDSAAKMADAVSQGAWDVAFLAVDPKRSDIIGFSAPYMEIQASYMVRDDSPIKGFGDVDRKGVRIATNNNAAFDLWMQRNLKNAERVPFANSPEAVERFLARKDLDAVAGVRNPLVAAAAKHPGYRVLEGSFASVGQAAGVPRNREASTGYLREFIEEMKRSGFIAKALKDSAVTEATVAPAAS